jgi:hypothetical protein
VELPYNKKIKMMISILSDSGITVNDIGRALGNAQEDNQPKQEPTSHYIANNNNNQWFIIPYLFCYHIKLLES